MYKSYDRKQAFSEGLLRNDHQATVTYGDKSKSKVTGFGKVVVTPNITLMNVMLKGKGPVVDPSPLQRPIVDPLTHQREYNSKEGLGYIAPKSTTRSGSKKTEKPIFPSA